MGDTQKWTVYKRNPTKMDVLEGFPISGNLHLEISGDNWCFSVRQGSHWSVCLDFTAGDVAIRAPQALFDKMLAMDLHLGFAGYPWGKLQNSKALQKRFCR